tara:strand:- start:190 stop:420 length:231 start_codon:yes stop_codon:yes gene_type:complete
MIEEKLAGGVGPSPEDEMISVLKKIEKHLETMVFYSTPERAYISSAGKAQPPALPTPETIAEVIKQEIKKYLKENK